jgi:hypothetical protein
MLRRREFIAGLGVAAWPLAAWAQQPDRVRRIGLTMSVANMRSEIWLSDLVHKRKS